NCRMCLVEVEKAPKLQTACTAPVADGMIVHTRSPKAIAGQNAVIEFLLANHPLDCPVCDRGGECPLQDNAFGYGKGLSVFAETKRHFVKPIPLSDNVLLDRERCIMCYRCVRFTREIAGDETLTVLERGSMSQIGLLEGRTFDSPFSGNTIEICPVGALTSAKYRFKARPWDIKTTPSICSQCSVGCNVNLTIRDNKIARVLSRENDSVDDGWLCDRGRFNYEFVAQPDRLTQPLIRRDGELEPASWPEAIGFIRDRIQETLVKSGPAAIAAVASPVGTNEEAYLVQKLMRAVIGSNNVDHSFDRYPADGRLPFDAASGSILGLERANVIFLVDVNPLIDQPVLDLRLKKAAGKGAKIIVIGPEKIDLVGYSTEWLQTRADTVADVIRAVVGVIAQENLVKEDFIAERVRGADAALSEARGFDLDAAAARIGLTREALGQAARSYASAGTASILYRRSRNSTALSDAIANLALLTGQIGRPGSGIYPLVIGANEQGAIDVGAVATRLPGQRSVDDARARQELSSQWGRIVPEAPGVPGADVLSAAAAGTISALYLIGQDPVSNLGAEAVSALQKLSLLVVQDIFLTETAKLATVVLPGATGAEKDGTVTNLERRIQRVRQAVTPPGEARPDWRIVSDLGVALGGDFDYRQASDILAEIAVVVPMYRGLTVAKLGSKGLQWPRRADGSGTESLYDQQDGPEFFDLAPRPQGDVRVGSSSE
ncbi:MAG TPA: NADH-quinone oxidoreductase subunit NuoG, partial [Chloroflexota bacterium]|nr:NADH-quinone oxidoreductase subunit NuoG [Chloroflexota bacterium]